MSVRLALSTISLYHSLKSSAFFIVSAPRVKGPYI